jgi:L-cysteine S-thiosulfotransferase
MRRRLIVAVAGLIGLVPAMAEPDPRRSGFDEMGPATQAMQRDDAANPGMLWVLDGEELWRRAAPGGGPSCAGCHGEAETSMRGVAARYPAFDAAEGRPIDLQGRVNLCRTARQKAPAFAAEGRELLALTTLVAHQSRGLPIAPPDDPRLAPARERGRALFSRRVGQLDLSCAQCHDERAGGRLAGNPIPQAHPTAYPLYRLEWQSLGSLQRRLRNCLTGVRAEPYPSGAPEYVELELYLMSRAAGMTVETPGVRP